jgi:hypothetical protein
MSWATLRRTATACLAAGALLGGEHVAAARADQTIAPDGQGSGRVFAGAGAISGGGGTSRLLTDYPQRQQRQILDYLFKPGYGASLQILKVEIGSDTDSTNGAEPSHMRTATDLDCNRGYEWWLMEQAKKRNPDIQLYGLEWGAPGWFNGGFWSQDNITYLLNWLGCARRHHLTIDYLGGWNERGWDKGWFESLKAALVAHGYGHVQVVGADSAGWGVATDMANDPAFDAAVDVIGIHYPCSAVHCSSSADALASGKPIFASESGWNDYLSGATRLAAEMNHEYVDSRITGFINWPAAYAWYPTVQLQGAGLLRANEPWSGHYELGPTLWTVAQTTQFAQPGWSYVDDASGYLTGGGTYVTLRSPSRRDYSVILETTGATAPQTVTLTPANLPLRTLHVRSTQLENGTPDTWFAREPDLAPAQDGAYTIALQPGRVYTVSTLEGGQSDAQSPPAAPLRIPYRDDFNGYEPQATPRYFSDMEGAFEVAHCGQGKCLRQVITHKPITWARVPSPVSLIGDIGWTDYTVSTKALLEQPGTISLLGRVVNELNSNKPPHLNIWQAYYLNASDTGAWSLTAVLANGTTRTLAQGQADALGSGRWHRLRLGFHGDEITASLDGKPLADVTDATYTHGEAGVMLGSYINAQLDDFAVTP